MGEERVLLMITIRARPDTAPKVTVAWSVGGGSRTRGYGAGSRQHGAVRREMERQ